MKHRVRVPSSYSPPPLKSRYTAAGAMFREMHADEEGICTQVPRRPDYRFLSLTGLLKP